MLRRVYTTTLTTQQFIDMLRCSFPDDREHAVIVTVVTEANRPDHGERGNVTVTFNDCDALD